jgi:hypothetical protein
MRSLLDGLNYQTASYSTMVCLCQSLNIKQASICDVNPLVLLDMPIFIVYMTLFFSLANAWEEEDEIVLIVCRMENPNLDQANGAIKEKLENISNEL